MSQYLKTAAAALAILLLAAGCNRTSAPEAPATAPETVTEAAADTPETAPEAEDAVPEAWSPDIAFSTVDADGTAWTDACFAENKLTMLNLWAYWCGPCVGELPDLQKLSEDYADKGLRILGVTDEGDFDRSVAKMAELGVSYPCLVLAGDMAEALSTGLCPPRFSWIRTARCWTGPTWAAGTMPPGLRSSRATWDEAAENAPAALGGRGAHRPGAAAGAERRGAGEGRRRLPGVHRRWVSGCVAGSSSPPC